MTKFNSAFRVTESTCNIVGIKLLPNQKPSMKSMTTMVEKCAEKRSNLKKRYHSVLEDKKALNFMLELCLHHLTIRISLAALFDLMQNLLLKSTLRRYKNLEIIITWLTSCPKDVEANLKSASSVFISPPSSTTLLRIV